MISVSLQTMRLGVLPWERLKNRENLELGPSWESQSNAIADLFVMFIAWTSQKASKVHKILSQKLAIALISNIQSLHITEENLSSWEMFKIITSEALDTAHSALLDRGTGAIYDSCRFDIGRFRAEPTNYKFVYTRVMHLHIAVPTITCTLRYA